MSGFSVRLAVLILTFTFDKKQLELFLLVYLFVAVQREIIATFNNCSDVTTL